MAGEKIIGVFDTEEDLAYYAFGKSHYGSGVLTSVCDYHDIYTPTGEKLSQKQYDQMIEKYFPQETAEINDRREIGNKPLFKHFVNWGMMDFWLVKQEKILKNLPDETVQKIQAVIERSNDYILSIFNENINERSFTKEHARTPRIS
jgi:hypothetical protein